MAATAATEGFWDFSVRTYGAEGAAPACLALQNEHGVDVNMLLFCCWAGGKVGEFDDSSFTRACEFSSEWSANVVRPLRSARTWMKETGCHSEHVLPDPCMRLREDIKAVELACEKMQQQALEAMIPDRPPRQRDSEQLLADVVANLLRYAAYSAIGMSDGVRRKLATVISAAYPGVDDKRVDEAFARLC